jgi:hypothetical protein
LEVCGSTFTFDFSRCFTHSARNAFVVRPEKGIASVDRLKVHNVLKAPAHAQQSVRLGTDSSYCNYVVGVELGRLEIPMFGPDKSSTAYKPNDNANDPDTKQPSAPHQL